MWLWINLCGWVYEPRADVKAKPFLTWPIQDEAIFAIHEAITDGHDLLFEKSRDMGATWIIVACFNHQWRWVPLTPLLMVSRKQDLVDASGNPDSIFYKLDFFNSRAPSWLIERPDRSLLHFGNPTNHSVIDGESTNADVARGGRRKAIMLDEFAAVPNGDEILSATADATPCRIFNSTPKGRGNAFASIRFSGKVKVFTMGWWRHPDKGKDAHQIVLPDGSKKWTSPWYEKEVARRTSRMEIAQELDIDYLSSGDAFFDLDVLQRVRGEGGLSDPSCCGELHYSTVTHSEGVFYDITDVEFRPDSGRRRLRLWCPLIEDRNGMLYPPQDVNYVAFADISNGQGASNSVLKVACVDTREEVASWECPDTSPTEFARQAVAICKWFKGEVGHCFLGWEANGPGGIFGREVYRCGYRHVLGNQNLLIPWHPENKKIGWHSSRDNKRLLLEDFRRALANGEFTLHDERTVAEAELYVHYPSGSIGPSELIDSPSGGRAEHGDRVIAAAGLVLCFKEQPSARAKKSMPSLWTPEGRFRDAMKQRQRQGIHRW